MKKAMKQLLGSTPKAVGRGAVGRQVGKALGKQAGRTIARTAASPWLLGADVAQLGAEKVARGLDCDEQTARTVGRGTGLLASVGIGAAVGGPIGAAAGAGVWVVGEAIGSLFD